MLFRSLQHRISTSQNLVATPSKACTIGLFGQSMGAATILLYAGMHPEQIAFVIEDCGYSSAKSAIYFQYKEANVPTFPLYQLVRLYAKLRHHFDLNRISPLNAIKDSKVPTLFIHGTNDHVVSTDEALRLYNTKNDSTDRLYLVEGAEIGRAHV